MYNIDLANVKSIVADIVAKHNVENVAFVGCGASKAELYPAKYFLANCSKKLRVAHYTANEFNYDTPDWLGDTTVVITASLRGKGRWCNRCQRYPRCRFCPDQGS